MEYLRYKMSKLMIGVTYYCRFKVRFLRKLGEDMWTRELHRIKYSTMLLSMLKIKKY
jgi:hypothetical protein